MKKLFSLVLLCSFSGAIWATDMGATAGQVPAFAEAMAGQVPSSLGEPATAGQAETKGEEVVGALVYGDGEIPLTQSRVDLFEVVRVALAEESGFAESRSRRFQINSEMFTREVFEALRGYFQVGVESLRELSGEQLVDLLALLDYLGMDFKVGVGQELKTNLLSLLKNRLSLEAVVAAANKLSGMPGSSEIAELGYEIRAQRIGFSPDDRFVWAMNKEIEGRWQIQLYDLGGGSLQAVGDVINGNDLGFSPDGKWAWVADAPGDNHRSSKIQIYRFDNGRLVAVGDWLDGSKVKFSPNGRLVQIWNSDQISLYKFNQGILEKVRDLSYEMHFSPDGRWCWISHGWSFFYIYEVVSQNGDLGAWRTSKQMQAWAGHSPDWQWFWISERGQFYPQIKLYKFIDGHLDGAGEFHGKRMGFSSDNKFVWVDVSGGRGYIQIYAFRKGVLKPVGKPFVGDEVEFSQKGNLFRVVDKSNPTRNWFGEFYSMKLYQFRDESFNQVARAQYGLGFSSNEQWFWRVDWSGASIFESALVEYPKELHMKLTLVQQMLVNYLIQRWRSYGVSYALDSDSVLLDIWMRLPDEIRSYLTTIKVVSLVYQYGILAKLAHRFIAVIES